MTYEEAIKKAAQGCWVKRPDWEFTKVKVSPTGKLLWWYKTDQQLRNFTPSDEEIAATDWVSLT